MTDLDYLEQYHDIKDVADICADIKKLDFLVSWNDWRAVEQHISDIYRKHSVEKAVYNLVNWVFPKSIQQSAANCRQFLLLLGTEKITKGLCKYMGGN